MGYKPRCPGYRPSYDNYPPNAPGRPKVPQHNINSVEEKCYALAQVLGGHYRRSASNTPHVVIWSPELDGFISICWFQAQQVWKLFWPFAYVGKEQKSIVVQEDNPDRIADAIDDLISKILKKEGNSMKISIEVRELYPEQIKLGQVRPGAAIVKHSGHFYHIMKDVGQGLTIKHDPESVVLINASTGGLKVVPRQAVVELVVPDSKSSLMLHPLDVAHVDMPQYLSCL